MLHHHSWEEHLVEEAENAIMFQPSINKLNNDTLVLNYKAGGIIQKAFVPVNSKIIYWRQGKWIDIQ